MAHAHSNTDIDDSLLTEADAAELLSVDVLLLRRWRRRGDGPPYIKFNGCTRYALKDVRVFVQRARRVPGSGAA